MITSLCVSFQKVLLWGLCVRVLFCRHQARWASTRLRSKHIASRRGCVDCSVDDIPTCSTFQLQSFSGADSNLEEDVAYNTCSRKHACGCSYAEHTQRQSDPPALDEHVIVLHQTGSWVVRVYVEVDID